ncbi:MAG: cysteine--tRNA ligase [Acidobacteria bacterium]|nr:cysteine--tRNA ligase [Acidobacteriota bacterium]
MALHLFNTLTNRLEPFVPLEDNIVRMYTCGPTVYDYAHIGNFRTFVFQDILRRYLRYSGYRLDHVMNITDVEDKIIRNAGQKGKSLREYTDFYIAALEEDARKLRLERPDRVVRATDHIPDMIAAIQKLGEKGITYQSDGSIYYRISGFPGYGKLSKIDVAGMRTGARVDVDEYDKADVRDFAVWKAPKPGEPFWDAPFGPGRPGWHIECSVMSMKYLGDTLDIHTGGIDLVFPHHENEIAQSEAITGKPFVRYWLHAEFLLVEGQKMSKSLGNFYTLRDVLARGHSPEAVRYLLASVPYRKQLNFTFDALQSAATAIERLRNFRLRLETERFRTGENPRLTELAGEARRQFEAGLDDDLNTAQALAAVFEYVREANTQMDAREFLEGNRAAALDLLSRFDRIFDVLEVSREGRLSTEEIERAIQERLSARKARDFAKADHIRKELADRGVILEDTKEGTRWKYS